MNYWPKHIGPWLKATVTLEPDEEGLYSRLCDWCYAQERPLPLDSDEIFRIARAHIKAHRDTTMSMVERFFVQTDTGWRHERIDRELANVRKRASRAAMERNKHAQHQRDYRDRRSVLFDQAQELGLPLPAGIRTTNEQLVTMIIEAGAKPKRASDHPSRALNGDASRDVSREASHASVTSAAKETTNVIQERDLKLREASRERHSEVTQAGAACKRMRSMGMASVNPSDPRLHSLLELGVDIEAIAMAAAQAVARGKGFAYALAIAKGEHEAQEHERAEMLKWAPGLAQG